MKSRVIFCLAMILWVAAAPARGEYYSQSVAAVPMQQKVTKLHFFLHDILSGQNPSAVMVAHGNFTDGDKSPTPFGSVFAVDDALRVGPDSNAKIIGNAQGLYVSSSQDANNFAIVMYIDFAITSGEFKGSSFSVFSRNPVSEPSRELAVVGGKGKFRMARGFAELKTAYFNGTNGDAIIEYNVSLFHY